MESLLLPTINKYLLPAQDQYGFRREHATISALLELTTDIAVGYNQRKPPDRTVCVAVDLSAGHCFTTYPGRGVVLQYTWVRAQFNDIPGCWILGVYLDSFLSFNKHSQYVAERVSGEQHPGGSTLF